MSVPKKTGVLLVARGCEQKATHSSLFSIVRELHRRFGSECIMPCFMEAGQPDIVTAVGRLVGRGCNQLVVHVFLQTTGERWPQDVPRLLRETLHEHPGVTFEISEGVFADPGLTDLVGQRLTHLLADGEAIG